MDVKCRRWLSMLLQKITLAADWLWQKRYNSTHPAYSRNASPWAFLSPATLCMWPSRPLCTVEAAIESVHCSCTLFLLAINEKRVCSSKGRVVYMPLVFKWREGTLPNIQRCQAGCPSQVCPKCHLRGEEKASNQNKHGTELVSMEIQRFTQPATASLRLHSLQLSL